MLSPKALRQSSHLWSVPPVQWNLPQPRENPLLGPTCGGWTSHELTQNGGKKLPWKIKTLSALIPCCGYRQGIFFADSFIHTNARQSVCVYIYIFIKVHLHIEVCTHIHTYMYIHKYMYISAYVELKDIKSKHCAVHTSSYVKRMRDQAHDSCWLCCLMNHPEALLCLVWYNQHRINCNQIGRTGCWDGGGEEPGEKDSCRGSGCWLGRKTGVQKSVSQQLEQGLGVLKEGR